jgi:serine protease Do
VWLGVEYQELDKNLAESLGIQERDLTNEGKRGMLLTDVYPGSPAEKMGLKADDVLITLTPEGGSAIDLAPENDRFDRYRYRPEGYTPWRPRKNYLTSLLTSLGPGKKATFTYLRGAEKKTADVVLEQSPVDYDTSEKFKDDALGFTVKELTYEVRYFQKLEANAGGVVVAKIESGSKAEVAKMQMLSIVTRVNGAAIKDLAHFKEMLEKTRAEKAKTITFTVQTFGQTRLVDLELGR